MKPLDIDLSVLDEDQFESLVYDLLHSIGFRGIDWRDGGADGGCDHVFEADEELPTGGKLTNKYFVQAKNFTSGVPFEKVFSALTKASAFGADRLLFVAYPHL